MGGVDWDAEVLSLRVVEVLIDFISLGTGLANHTLINQNIFSEFKIPHYFVG